MSFLNPAGDCGGHGTSHGCKSPFVRWSWPCLWRPRCDDTYAGLSGKMATSTECQTTVLAEVTARMSAAVAVAAVAAVVVVTPKGKHWRQPARRAGWPGRDKGRQPMTAGSFWLGSQPSTGLRGLASYLAGVAAFPPQNGRFGAVSAAPCRATRKTGLPSRPRTA